MATSTFLEDGTHHMDSQRAIILSLWKNVVYYLILFLAGLRNIPEIYYEAASVDGATSWQRFRRITIPLLKFSPAAPSDLR